MRSPSDETLDPQLAHQLEMLEAELGSDLKALKPDIEQEFARDLDAWAAEGFPGKPGPLHGVGQRLTSFWGRLRAKQVVLGVTGSAAIALVVATAVVSSQQGSDTATVLHGRPGVAQIEPAQAPRTLRPPNAEAAPSAGATGAATAAPPIAIAPSPGGLRARQIERSAELTLGTDPDHVQDVSGKVFDTVRRYDGIVLSSSVRDGIQGEGGAQFELLFPSFRLGDALGDLSRLAEVRSRNESTLDITKPFVTVRQHLRDARAEATSLLRQLASATTQSERDSLKAQLRQARGRIARLRTRQARIQRRADFSRVSLAITTGESGSAFPGSGNDGWSLGDAVHDAGKVLSTAAGVALIWLAVLAPIALLAGLAWAAWRALVRRARDGVLD